MTEGLMPREAEARAFDSRRNREMERPTSMAAWADSIRSSPKSRSQLGLSLLLVGIALWGCLDLSMDDSRWLSLHVLAELCFIGLLLGSVNYLYSGWLSAHLGLQGVRAQLDSVREDRDIWRERATDLLQEFAREMDAQFDRWSLTPAERGVARLLLRGLEHREIAAELSRSDKTIRQHAASLYQKSGLSGRAALAAFFLEDLLLPPAASTRNEPGHPESALEHRAL